MALKSLIKLFKQIEYRMLEARRKRDNAVIVGDLHQAYWDGKANAYKTVLTLIKRRRINETMHGL